MTGTSASDSTRIRVSLIALLGCVACGRSQERQHVSEGLVHVSAEEAIAWHGRGTVMFSQLEQWAQGNFSQPDCKGSGVYAVDSLGKSAPLLTGAAVCDILLAGRVVDASPDGTGFIYYRARRFLHLAFKSGRSTPVTDSLSGLSQVAAWRPDGRRILFPDSSDGDKHLYLYLVNPDGSSRRSVRSLGDWRVASVPSWSPYMQRTVFAVYPAGRAPYLTPGAVVVADTLGNPWRVVASGYEPSWSPLGEWIAYISISTRSSNKSVRQPGQPSLDGSTGTVHTLVYSLRIVRPDGTADRELYRSSDTATFGMHDRTIEGGPWGRLVWSSDGARVAFARRFEAGSTVWVIRVDGTQLTSLTTGDIRQP